LRQSYGWIHPRITRKATEAYGLANHSRTDRSQARQFAGKTAAVVTSQNANPMNTEQDPLIARLIEMDPDFKEWDSAFPVLGTLSAQLAQNMERHVKAGNELVSRVERGVDADANIAELREIFSKYGPTLRMLSMNAIRISHIAARIHTKLEKLSEP
jgi:hypothetical protein